MTWMTTTAAPAWCTLLSHSLATASDVNSIGVHVYFDAGFPWMSNHALLWNCCCCVKQTFVGMTVTYIEADTPNEQMHYHRYQLTTVFD